jgi:phosphoribosylaminoimidazole-succinocarboxamide synthase
MPQQGHGRTEPIDTVVRKGSTTVVSVAGLGELAFARTGHLSAFDVGPCSHEFADIGALRTEFAVRFFKMLSQAGIMSHFRRRDAESRNTFIGQALRTMALDEGDYFEIDSPTGASTGRLIPIEWIVRTEVATLGFIKRLDDPSDPLTRERIQLRDGIKLKVGDSIPLFVECTTKLEPKDRYLVDEEALKISGLTENQFGQAVQLMRHVAGLLVAQAAKNGLRLKDFKLELGITDDGRIIVADGLSPDELRLANADGASLDKDIFRNWLTDQGYKTAVDAARQEKKVLPAYPDIPPEVSAQVSAGYRQAVEQFWR